MSRMRCGNPVKEQGYPGFHTLNLPPYPLPEGLPPNRSGGAEKKSPSLGIFLPNEAELLHSKGLGSLVLRSSCRRRGLLLITTSSLLTLLRGQLDICRRRQTEVSGSLRSGNSAESNNPV